MSFIICQGVEKGMICRFNGACYGEICIAPSICRKKDDELTEDDKARIQRFAQEEENR